MEQEIQILKNQIEELLQWKRERDIQIIKYPIDDVSQRIIEDTLPIPDITNEGSGATDLTQTYSVSGGAGGTVDAPKAYIDTIILQIDGTNYEIPYIANP